MEKLLTKKIIIGIISILMIFQIGIFSQTTTGRLFGKVQDENGNTVENAGITLKGTILLGSATAITDKNGEFELFDLPPGEYQLTIKHIAFNTITYEKVSVLLGKTTSLGDIVLTTNAIELEEVIVIWKKPILDMKSTTIGSNIESRVFETLPSERDYMSIISLMPQSNTSFYGDQVNIAGGTGSDNAYFIDGMNVTNPFNSSSGTLLPFNFVDAIEVKQSGYEAEFGKALGGIINLVTPSGSNKFEIGAFSFYTNDLMMKDHRIDSTVARDVKSYSKYDFGISMGGPIIKDKFWYFLAYNPIFDYKDIDIPGFGIYKDSKITHAFAAKLDWIALRNTRFNFSAVGDISRHKEAGLGYWGSMPVVENIDPLLANKNTDNIHMVLSIKKHTVKDFFLTGTFYFSQWVEKISGQTEIGRTQPLMYDFVVNSISGGYGLLQDLRNRRMGTKFSVEKKWQKHNMKSGIYLELMTENFKEFKFSNPGMITRISPAPEEFYTVLTFIVEGNPKKILPTYYLQDRWDLSERLTINYGIRWDMQFYKSETYDMKLNIPFQIQPRIGFIFQPGRKGEYKLFGSYGRYYAEYPMVSFTEISTFIDNSVFIYNTDPRLVNSMPTDTMIYDPKEANIYFVDNIKLKGEFADEFLLGFEMKLFKNLKFGIKSQYNELKQAISYGLVPPYDKWFIGNPGRGAIEFLDHYSRKYASLEFSLGNTGSDKLSFFTSYVLSLLKGNYPGFYDQDQSNMAPGNFMNLQIEEQNRNSYGYLPSDRRHIFKIYTSYKFRFGLTAGLSFSYMTGTPLNEFGQSSFQTYRNLCLVERGSAGRLPDLWDLNMRFTYNFKVFKVENNVFLDILHIGNTEKDVARNQLHYNGIERDVNGNPVYDENGWPVQTDPNPNYGKATKYQPPMMVRLGISIAL